MSPAGAIDSTVEDGQVRRRKRAAAAVWLVLLAGLTVGFYQNFAEMWRRWFPRWHRTQLSLYDRIVEGESYYTHGPLIPLVSLLAAFLLIRNVSIPVRPKRVAGMIVLVLSLLLHLTASLARVNFASGFAFIGVLVGLVLVLWGWAALRRLWFPIALLLFMVPLPEIMIGRLNFRLKMIAANSGVRLAEMLGTVIAQNGNQVHLQGEKTLIIANVCNGLRTLISLTAFGALYAYVCRLRGPWRLGLFLMTIPVALASNAIRILSLILVADIWTVELATGWFHDLSGLMIFVLAFLMMFGLERLVLWVRKAIGRPAQVVPLFHNARRGPGDEDQWSRMVRAPGRRSAAVAAVLVAVSAAATLWMNRTIPSIWHQDVASRAMPRQIQVAGLAWTGRDGSLTEKEEDILETRDYLVRNYDAPGATPVQFCVIFSQDNRKGTHPPEVCLEGGGQDIIHSEAVTVGGVEGRGEVPCRELVVQSPRGRHYFLYTYKCSREYTASFWKQQLTIFVNGLLNRNASGALIRVSTRMQGRDPADAQRISMEFLRTAVPHLDRELP